jgi:anthranilate synthase component 2
MTARRTTPVIPDVGVGVPPPTQNWKQGPRHPPAVGPHPHDSYTWNLVHLVASVTGVLPTVVQHDEVDPDQVLRHSHVVLSPGPGTPASAVDFSVGREVLLAGSRPVLGVCLGMQGLVTTYGGTVDRVLPAHGVVERIRHDGAGVFEGLPQLFAAVRYHSLAALDLPDELVVTASDAGGDVVMGVRHVALPQEGVQFHPESILSEHGAAMVANFLGLA